MSTNTVPEIMTSAEFKSRLSKALDDARAFDAKYTSDPMVLSIIMQLESVQKWTRSGPLTQDQRRSLSFGILALHAVNPVDEQLAQELVAIAHYAQISWR